MRRLLPWLVVVLAPLPAMAADLLVAVGRSQPPYVIAEQRRGLEYDIVREALALEGHTITPRFTAYARSIREMEDGLVDAALTMRPDSGVHAFYSDVHVTYRNVVLTLASNHHTIRTPADLAGKSVIAFQNAESILGPDFHTMAGANPHYREEPRQTVQPMLLFNNRIDAVVSDRFIFAWYANAAEVRSKADTGQTLHVHAIFPPTDYHVAFRSAELRDSFNRGLRKLRESGAYDRIVQRYAPHLREEGGG